MSEAGALRDIEDRDDCERLVRAFYGRALADPVIGWIFTDVARLDLEQHVPQITSFWETILLDARSYGGGAFAPHVALHMRIGLRHGHFQRWLALWTETVDSLFAGERAELAKAHAQRVAGAFQRRLSAVPSPGAASGPGTLGEEAGAVRGGSGSAGPAPGGLAITRHGPAA